MMTYHAYKVLHLTSLFMILIPLGGMAVHAINGGGRKHKFRWQVAVTHGIGMLGSIVSGFGLLARIDGASPIPGWAIAKMGIWLALGLVVSPLMRKPQSARILWYVIIALAASAGLPGEL
jgi:hypothetical protein